MGYILACIIFIVIGLETIADQQQWNFQKEQKRLLNSGSLQSDLHKQGFLIKEEK